VKQDPFLFARPPLTDLKASAKLILWREPWDGDWRDVLLHQLVSTHEWARRLQRAVEVHLPLPDVGDRALGFRLHTEKNKACVNTPLLLLEYQGCVGSRREG
jgi:hypothetical protein